MNEDMLPSMPQTNPTSLFIEGSTPSRPARWWMAVVLAILLLIPLAWLLARLIWLPFYFGLFFFLVAGLLVGAASFRVARSARPLVKSRLVTGVCLATVFTTGVAVFWEYHGFSASVAADRRFPVAKNAAISAGETVGAVKTEATAEFRRVLWAEWPPGGAIGYVRWAASSGTMSLTVRGSTEVITNPHRGYTWPLRTTAAAILLALGLWLSFESLRSPTPVSNILVPGEEAEDEEEEEKKAE